MTEEHVGTVISTMEAPSPSKVDFVVTKGVVHRGQFVELPFEKGKLIALVTNVYKTNKYFERADSVKEFESNGSALFEQFPTSEWEFLLAETKPLGIFSEGVSKRPSFPPSPGTKVFNASPDLLQKFFKFEEKGLHLGELEYHKADVKLNLDKLLKKHCAILALSGAGKCLDKHSEVLLSTGERVKISELVDKHIEKQKIIEDGVEICNANPDNLKVFSLTEENKVVSSEIKSFMRRTSPKNIYKIKTRTGKELITTAEHPLPILNEKIKWSQAQKLEQGDYLINALPEIGGSEQVIDFVDLLEDSDKVRISDKEIIDYIKSKIKGKYTFKEFVKKTKIPLRRLIYGLKDYAISLKDLKTICSQLFVDFSEIKSKINRLEYSRNAIPARVKVDEDFARLMAYLLAEGHNQGGWISFTNNSEVVRKDFSDLMLKVFGLKTIQSKNRESEVKVSRRILSWSLFKIGFTNSSWTKFVPREILLSRKPVLANFLGAFIDCDGHVASNKSQIEICLASKQMLDEIDQMIMRFGAVSVRKTKRVNGKDYARLFLGGEDVSVLGNNLNLLIDYKAEALEKISLKKSNTNVRVVPNLHKTFRKLSESLCLPQDKFAPLANYLSRKDNPSFSSFKNLLKEFEENYSEMEVSIYQIKNLFHSLPNLTEEDAKQILSNAYGKYDFNQIAKGTNVSCTTARRIVRGITEPRMNSFKLAENVLNLEDESDLGIEIINRTNFKELVTKINVLSKNIGFEIRELCAKSGFNKQYLDSFKSNNQRTLKYSNVYTVLYNLFIFSLKKEQELKQVREDLDFLNSIAYSDLFFDRIEKIEEIKSNSEYVYDLCVENHNFVANDLIVHNSITSSVLIEELLDRKKEQGRVAIVALDPHGEYTSFAQPPEKGSEFKDYSDRTKVVKGQNIRIAVPKLNASIIGGIIPGLSAQQRRDLDRVLNDLKKEMKSGLGPFDWAEVQATIKKDERIKGNTKNALLSWLAELHYLKLFSKTDSPSVRELVKAGTLTVIDLSDIVDMRKKQVIVSYFAKILFNERRNAVIPPTLLIMEEAHQFIPQYTAKEASISRSIIRTIAREGRKFGLSLCLISQRPVQLDTTTLSQCNSQIIMRITNPNDLKHISESAEAIDSRSMQIINSLQVGEALLIGEATGYPLFFRVRWRKSPPSKHEQTLEEAAISFEESNDKRNEEAEAFL